jgi:uncharacterized membrane protein YcjF (UPF0283 family)
VWQLEVGYGDCVTDPADLEQVPIKVVPMYIDETAPVETAPVDGETDPQRAARKNRWGLLGLAALVVAALALVTQAIAIIVASASDFAAGTVLGYLAIGLSVLSVAGGIAAVVTRRGRRAGAAGIALGVVGNPLFVLGVLRLLDSVRG